MPTSAAEILKATVDDIFNDPRASVVCLVPTLLPLAAIYVATFATVTAFGTMDTTSTNAVEDQLNNISDGQFGLLALVTVALIVAAVIGGLWTAVAWHRMIVLGE